jgi:hypothetical protein
MGKGKPRHNPKKKQNQMGSYCSYFEREGVCEAGHNAYVCNGNPHNCIKEKYLALAGKSK